MQWVLMEDGGEEGVLTVHLTQEAVQEAIFNNIHRKRFFLAEAALICSGGLRGSFGYNSTTRTARAILNGTYIFPPDFDQATREILKECASIHVIFEGGLEGTMEGASRINVFLRIGPALRTAYHRITYRTSMLLKRPSSYIGALSSLGGPGACR